MAINRDEIFVVISGVMPLLITVGLIALMSILVSLFIPERYATVAWYIGAFVILTLFFIRLIKGRS